MALRALGDRDAAKDVAQETLARAVEAVRGGRFREGESFGAFVRGIARHVITDLLRTSGRTRSFETLPDSNKQAASTDALGALISEEEKERLRLALERLSKDDHEILYLSYFEGLTPAQIADREGEPPARVRKRKSRALERLRRAFLGKTKTRHESP
ncbi:MAG: sigma-70 family RNA polymerase sigma factor [Gemmatimonadetes bacterium]|nr:sigma-70 family RNA polymerase sigma factor [Gemmatimonadota bacterium]